MNSKYLHALAAILAGATAAHAQEAQQPTPAQAPPTIRPSEPQVEDERDPLIRWSRGPMDVREMLQALDQACPQQILIGEGVSGRVSHDGSPMRLSKFLDTLCAAANLTWGYLNRDTIVVLRARPAAYTLQAPPLYIMPRTAPAPRPFSGPLIPLPRQPLVPRNPLDPRSPLNPPGLELDPSFEFGTRPGGVPENARPYTFNGQRFYIVPLQPALHAEPSVAPAPNEPPEIIQR